MPETLTNRIYYPTGDTLPNIPAVLQTLAESTDSAVSRISEAPFLVCTKTAPQTVNKTATAVLWDTETWNQGLGRDPQDLSKILILEDGLYSVNARLCYVGNNAGNGTGLGGVILNVNGVDRQDSWMDADASGGRAPKPCSITDQRFKAGDVVRVMAFGAPVATALIPAECVLNIRKSAGYSATGQGTR